MRLLTAGMNTVADPASINNLNPKSAQYGQCVDICDCDLDDEHNPSRRDGFLLVAGVAVSSAWTSKAGVTYCVSGGYLCTFDGAEVTPLTTDFTVLAECEFEQVNDVVVFSDNEKIGIISGSTVTRIDKPSDWVDVADLEQWIADHYPADPAAWDGVTSNSNFDVDAFKLATLAGCCLHHYNGALYLAVDNFVYVTKTHNIEQMDIRYNVIAGYADPVTMIQHVAGGLVVGTTKAVYFHDGGGLVVDDGKIVSSFSQIQVSAYGAIYGTDLPVQADKIPRLQATGMACLWSSAEGVFVGLPGGTVVNLSAEKVTLPDVARGTALLKDRSGSLQYVVCFNTAAELFINSGTAIDEAALENTWALNLNSGTHSRFTRYLFNSLFRRGSAYYGANVFGIYRFEGDTDFAGVAVFEKAINAFILTPAMDFGKRQVKVLPELYLQARCAGELAVDYYVDEQLEQEDDVIYFDGVSAAHTLRARPARGLRGVFWQFKFKNVAGSRFTILNIEPLPVASATRTR